MGNLFSGPKNHSTRPQLDSIRGNTNIVDTLLVVPPSAQQQPGLPILSDTFTLATAQSTTIPSSVDVPYTVFISHAGEDKATIAFPLREKLRANGITAFVDEADMPCGTDAIPAMTHAMETARIGVFILSPEFVAKKWPMRELMCFLRRRAECCREGHRGVEAPTIIPCFYRLNVHELYKEPRVNSEDPNDKRIYEESRFLERQGKGQPEADVEKIKISLQKLHGIMGVRNDVDASNESSHLMSKRRELLLDELCTKICESTAKDVSIGNSTYASPGRDDNSFQPHGFRRWFPPKLTGKRAVLDFDSRNVDGSPTTPEGEIKKHLLSENDGSAGIVSLCGGGGVGKSTVVEALMSDDDTRKHFVDGVHLVKLGSDASKNALLESIYYILKVSGADREVESLRERSDTKEVIEVFKKRFEGKRCAFFIDDVSKHSVNVRELSRLCDIASVDGGNKIMITTREDEIASLTQEAKVIRLDARESRGEVARKMLFFHCGINENDADMTNAADSISGILDICAGLPVSLAVAGKNVRKLICKSKKHSASVWARYVSRLRANRQRLLEEDVGSYRNLYATFLTSLEFLDNASEGRPTDVRPKCSYKEMHRRLCVLQKQAAVPNTMLKHLWEMEGEENAEMIAEAFAEVGLGDTKTVEDGTNWNLLFSLHDSVHDFALSEARRHGEIAKAHEILLKGYGSRHEEVCAEREDKKVRWWSQELAEDGYIHKQLCRHLVACGRRSELCDLLLTPLWVERQLEVNGIMAIEKDFQTGMKEIGEDEETKGALSLIADAVNLSLAHVLKNEGELWFQLHGRLIGCIGRNMTVDKYLERMENNVTKPRVLCVNGVLAGGGGRNTKVIPIEDYEVTCMSLFPNEERVACGCSNGRVVVVNIRLSKIEREWQAYEDETDEDETDGRYVAVLSLAMLQGGTQIVSMQGRRFESGWLHVWNVESSQRVMTIGGPNYAVRCFAITHDESWVVCVSEEGALQFWNLNDGEMVNSGINVGDSAGDIALFKDQERAIIGYREGKQIIWNIRTGAQLGELDHGSRVVFFMMTPDERSAVSCSLFGRIAFWDLKSRQQVWCSKSNRSDAIVAVSTDGSRIAVGDISYAIQILDMKSGSAVCEPLKGHTHEITGVSFLGNKDSIVSCSWDGTIRVWDIARGQIKKSVNRHEARVMGVSFAPDGKFVVTGSWDRTLRVWDTATGRAVGDRLHGHSRCVYDVAVTSDGRFVVSVSNDKVVGVWDLESRKLLHTFEGHTHDVACVAVTPTGRAVTGSLDKTVLVWDLGKMDGTHSVFEEHVDGVMRVFVSDDGLRVVSVDIMNNILVWRMETKQVLKRAKETNAWNMSRGEVFSLIGEHIGQDEVPHEAGISIRRYSNQIMHRKGSEARVLATLESDVWSWDISPDKKTICLGLRDGQVALLKVDV